ncbi:MAG: hypothetical protein VCD31_02540 [Alphaproteobacteria bacterium]
MLDRLARVDGFHHRKLFGVLSSINWAKRISAVLRSLGAILRQSPFSNAARAALTARSTSSSPQFATWVSRVPSHGLMQSKVSPEAEAT